MQVVQLLMERAQAVEAAARPQQHFTLVQQQSPSRLLAALLLAPQSPSPSLSTLKHAALPVRTLLVSVPRRLELPLASPATGSCSGW